MLDCIVGSKMLVGQKGGYLAALVSLVLTSTICTLYFCSVLKFALVETIRNDPETVLSLSTS